MMSARESLERLRQGNRRFARGVRDRGTLPDPARRSELVAGQEPFAVVLGCSDSRVPPEIVFDQGPGDLFVIRVAGHVVSPPQVESVEYAAHVLGTRLVVVLGHSGCGAVGATLDALEHPGGRGALELGSIVESIRPSVEPLLEEARPGYDRDALARDAVRANVRASAERLRRDSPLLDGLARRGRLQVVGAECSLESGVVEFFGDAAETG